MKHETILNQETIEAEQFDLRPLRKTDVGLIERFGADERVARMTTTIPHPLPPGLVEKLVSQAMSEPRDEDFWVLDGSKSGQSEVMGLISLERMDRGQSEIGYWVAPEFWGRGYARMAVEALIAANPMRNSAIFASVFQDNPASSQVLTNCGFAYLGDAESFSVARDAPVPTWTYLKKLSDA